MPLDARFRIDAVVGQHVGRFLFDTGFTVTTIDPGVADRWCLEPVTGPNVDVTDAIGIVRPIDRWVRLHDLRVGDTRFSALAPVIPLPPAFGIDGVIGMNTMRLLAWIVDVPAGRLCVVNPDNLEHRLKELYPSASWTAVPLLDDGDGWSVPVELVGNGYESTTLRLDTGARATSLPSALVKRLGLPDGGDERRHQDDARAEALRRELEEQGLQVASVSVTTSTEQSTLFGEADSPWFLLGGLRLGRIACDLLTVNESVEPQGMLGADVLGSIVWALDGPGARLLVRDR